LTPHNQGQERGGPKKVRWNRAPKQEARKVKEGICQKAVLNFTTNGSGSVDGNIKEKPQHVLKEKERDGNSTLPWKEGGQRKNMGISKRLRRLGWSDRKNIGRRVVASSQKNFPELCPEGRGT